MSAGCKWGREVYIVAYAFRFQPKLSGEIRIQGKEIGSYTDKQLSKVISVVLTEKCDIRNMTSVELIGLGRSPYTGFWGTLSKEDKEVVDHAINLVGISHLAHRMVHTLSDGERQKVMIGQGTGSGNSGDYPGRTYCLP